jgi:hypothetical protein
MEIVLYIVVMVLGWMLFRLRTDGPDHDSKDL